MPCVCWALLAQPGSSIHRIHLSWSSTAATVHILSRVVFGSSGHVQRPDGGVLQVRTLF